MNQILLRFQGLHPTEANLNRFQALNQGLKIINSQEKISNLGTEPAEDRQIQDLPPQMITTAETETETVTEIENTIQMITTIDERSRITMSTVTGTVAIITM